MNKIVAVRLHEGLFVTGGIGDLGKVLPSPSKTVTELEFSGFPEGLMISGKRKNQKFATLVPWPNVAQADLDPNSSKE